MEKGTKQKETQLFKKLKKVCKKCTEASMKVYMRNIKRLWKLVHDGDSPVPLTGSWMRQKKLLEAVRNKPLNLRRHLSISAVKACKMYGVSSDKWSVQMYKDANLYERERSKNKKTPVESEKWPKKGYKSVKEASTEMMKRVRVLMRSGKPSMSTLYKYQMALVLRLYSEIPFRNLWGTFSLKKGENNNYIENPKKGNISFVVRQHKSAKSIGPKTVHLSRGASMFLRKFLQYRAQVVDNDHLLNTMKQAKMTRATLGKALHRTTGEILGKKFGSRLIRVLAATASRKELEKVQELGHKMLHSGGSKQTAQYSRKD